MKKCVECKKKSKETKVHPYNKKDVYCVTCWNFWFS